MSFEQLPKHPAIGNEIRVIEKYGSNTPCAPLTCPSCKDTRWMPAYVLRQYFSRKERFTGHCRKCKSPQIQAGHKMWLTRNSMGKHLTSNGYVILTRSTISADDLWLFDAMRVTAGGVLEHRMVMAKHLGRPLTRKECIDHMDGNKQNNKLRNLRLYRMHTNDGGNTPGHGTYYHEWQMALAEIARLKSQ